MLGRYKITYSNGVTQTKNLIDQKIYDDFKKATDPKEVGEKEINKLKKEFKKLYGDEFFTTESPLALAMRIGQLVLPETQGGTTKCEIVLVD